MCTVSTVSNDADRRRPVWGRSPETPGISDVYQIVINGPSTQHADMGDCAMPESRPGEERS